MKDYLLDETSFILLQFNRIPCNSESDILSSKTISTRLKTLSTTH